MTENSEVDQEFLVDGEWASFDTLKERHSCLFEAAREAYPDGQPTERSRQAMKNIESLLDLTPTRFTVRDAT